MYHNELPDSLLQGRRRSKCSASCPGCNFPKDMRILMTLYIHVYVNEAMCHVKLFCPWLQGQGHRRSKWWKLILNHFLGNAYEDLNIICRKWSMPQGNVSDWFLISWIKRSRSQTWVKLCVPVWGVRWDDMTCGILGPIPSTIQLHFIPSHMPVHFLISPSADWPSCFGQGICRSPSGSIFFKIIEGGW